ncbi:MAG TPA: hypothetical protein VIO60_05180 [Rectinemataceae bacterium]
MRSTGKALRLWCAACFALVFAAGSLGADPASQGIGFSLNGVRFNNAILGGLPLPAGADIELRFPLSSSGLLFSLRLAGGYEDRLILRDDDADPIAKPAALGANWFNWPNAQVDAGPVYSMALAGGGGARLEAFFLARGRWELNSSSLSTAHFPDSRGLLGVSALAGAGVDAVMKDPSRMLSGWGGEVSFEAAPSFLSFQGGNDFYRLSGFLEGYLPLYSSSEDDLRAISLYAAGYLAGDWAFGSSIPLYVLTSFGGRKLRDGLGDSIRGYQGWGYEASAKAEASFDLRLVGPSLFKVAGLRPIAYIFGDAGWYGGLYDCPSLADSDGILFSAGAGAALDILDFAYLGLRAGWRFTIGDPLFPIYEPGGEAFFWGISFLLHF